MTKKIEIVESTAEWQFDPELEAISNKIRMGEPVGFFETIAAIDYQEALKRNKRNGVWWRRVLRLFKPNVSDQATASARHC